MDCRIAHLFLDVGKSDSMELHHMFFLDAAKSELAFLQRLRLIEF